METGKDAFLLLRTFWGSYIADLVGFNILVNT